MPTKHKKTTWRDLLHNRIVIIVLILVLILALWGIVSRIHAEHGLRDRTNEQALTTVTVIKAPKGPESEEIVLPGTVSPWHEAPIYARTSGYVKHWYTGFGTHVKAGQLLAEIETPEVDAQLRQAEADVLTAEANDKLAQITAARWQVLLKTNAVSAQEADEKTGAAQAQAAALAAARANRDRLLELAGFQRITAPFDGVITARLLDIGQLINAGNNSGEVLFRLADTSTLRIYVQVPQLYIGAITPDLHGELHFAEHPGKVYPVTLYTTAESLNSDTRTELIEFLYDNHKHDLLPGGYTEIHLKLAASADSVRLPVETLLFRAGGLKVASIDENQHAVLKPITIGRDFGKQVEVLSGIEPGEPVVMNPPDSLENGQQVRVVTPEQAAQEAQQKRDKDKKGNKDEKGGKENSKPISKTKDNGLINNGGKNGQSGGQSSQDSAPHQSQSSQENGKGS